MPELIFVTGNKEKLTAAVHTGATYDIQIVQESPEIDEIQSEDAEHIARAKAQSAFNVIGKPPVVSDDSWAITGLHGFPGAYMKSMNHWLSVDDFLRLTSSLEDKSCTLHQILVYQDATQQIVFGRQVAGTILTEAHGDTNIPWAAIVTMDGDEGKTIREVQSSGVDNSGRAAALVWHDLFQWYKENMA